MLRRVNIQDWQLVTESDFNNFGIFPQQTFDAILGDLGPGLAFAGFGVAQSGPASVVLGPGRLYTNAGPVYYIGEGAGAEIDLLAQLPVVTRRWAAITIWGQEIETVTEPRSFLTDATTRATVQRVIATETRRHVNYAAVLGTEAPDPVRPAITSNVLTVAWVLLSPTGIAGILSNEEARANSLRSLGIRAADQDLWRSRTGTRLDTLASDLASLSGRLDNTAQLGFVLDLSRDMARVKEQAGLPQSYTAWSADRFLTPQYSETTDLAYMAKVEEGIRFPPAAERNAQIALLDQFNQTVTVQNNFVLPTYTEVARIEVLGNDAELSIAQYSFQTINWVQLAKTRLRIRFGTPFWWCSNSWWWDDWGHEGVLQFDLTYDPIKNIFVRPTTGETFQILTGSYTDWPDHTVIRLQQFWVDEVVDEYYWDRVVTTDGVNGSIIGQTFLLAQEGWLTSVDLFFTRAAGDGDVNVMICETWNGAPVFDRVIAKTTIPAAQLRTYPLSSRAAFTPAYLKKDRYAIVLQTAGNHFVSLVTNNKFAQGSLFHSTDGAWAMGDLNRDLTFRLNFAQFEATRVAVQLMPLELTNGIAAVDINVDSVRPAVCSTTFEVQIGGVWTAFGAYESNPLTGLPAMLPFRVVFTGTTDTMPGIGVGPNGWVYTWRPRPDFRHVSTIQTLPTPCNTIYVDLVLEQWRGTPQTCNVRLLTGAGYTTQVTPTVVDDRQDRRDATAITRRCTFNLPSPVNSFRIRIDGTTDNVLDCFHVADRVQVSLFT